MIIDEENFLAREHGGIYMYMRDGIKFANIPRRNKPLLVVDSIYNIDCCSCDECKVLSPVAEYNLLNPSTEFLCETCYKKKFFSCANCHNNAPVKDINYWKDVTLCNECNKEFNNE